MALLNPARAELLQLASHSKARSNVGRHSPSLRSVIYPSLRSVSLHIISVIFHRLAKTSPE